MNFEQFKSRWGHKESDYGSGKTKSPQQVTLPSVRSAQV
jgi:hypothetical protein